MKRRTVVWVTGIAVVQYVFAFLSWSMAPGNSVPRAALTSARSAWAVMSFPLFYLFPRDLMHFDFLLIMNAVLWGVALGWGLPKLWRKAPQPSAQ
jgi:hypothetical protein